MTAKVKKGLDPHLNDSPSTSRRIALKASGNLMIGHSGGVGSTVVLDVLNRCYFPSEEDLEKVAKSHPRKKRVWEKAYICHVDISSAFSEVRKNALEFAMTSLFLLNRDNLILELTVFERLSSRTSTLNLYPQSSKMPSIQIGGRKSQMRIHLTVVFS